MREPSDNFQSRMGLLGELGSALFSTERVELCGIETPEPSEQDGVIRETGLVAL
jgi:hypothetical protein